MDNAHAGMPLLLLGQITNTLRKKGILDDAEIAIWRTQFAIAARDHPNLAGSAQGCNAILDDAIKASTPK